MALISIVVDRLLEAEQEPDTDPESERATDHPEEPETGDDEESESGGGLGRLVGLAGVLTLLVVGVLALWVLRRRGDEDGEDDADTA